VSMHEMMSRMLARERMARARGARWLISTLAAASIALGGSPQAAAWGGAALPDEEPPWELPLDPVELGDPSWVDEPPTDEPPTDEPPADVLPFGEPAPVLRAAPIEPDDDEDGLDGEPFESAPVRDANARRGEIWRDEGRRDSGQRLHLSIDIDRGRTVELVEQRAGVDDSGQVVCTSPCDRTLRVDPYARYVVTGPNVTTSFAFRFPEQERVTLRVRGGRSGMRIGGFAVVSLGLAMMGASAAIWVAASGIEDPAARQTPRTVGAALLGAGFIGIIGGIAMIVRSRTRVTID
jgi:hypothetical protein